MVDLLRILSIYSAETIVIIIHSILLYKIIKRKKRTKSSISLIVFFSSTIIGVVFNYIFILIQIDPLAFILYIITAFLVLFSSLYLLLALWFLYSDLGKQNIILINVIYIVVIILILSIPEGIKYDQTTNWTPEYSWLFFIVSYIFIIIGGVLPSIYILSRVLKKLASSKLKKRIWIYFSGEILYFIAVLGLALYNTVENQVFKSLWVIIGHALVIIMAIAVYYGLGKEFTE